MPGILLIVPDDDYQRRVFRDEARAVWSAGLSVVLEKHGFLAFEEATPEALSDESRLAGYDAVLIARIPDDLWTSELSQRLLRGPTQVLVEGPAPPALADAIGIQRLGPIDDEGAVVVTDPTLRTDVEPYGAPPGCALTMPTRVPIDREPALDWTQMPNVPLTAEQARAWGARAWDVERWGQLRAGNPLCEWVSLPASEERHPAIVRSGPVTTCCFGLFAFLTQRHTSEPYEGNEWRSTDRCYGLEVVLLALLDQMHRRAGSVRARCMPWPAGSRWMPMLRYDIAGAVPDPVATSLVAAHAASTVSGTWFWPASQAGSESLKIVGGSPREEVALNAQGVWRDGEAELSALAVATGRRPFGVAALGSSLAFRYQGAPNVLWAVANGLSYVDMAGRSHLHPHRFPTLAPDGTVGTADIVCLPPAESLDHLAGDRETLAATTTSWRAVGGLLQFRLTANGSAPGKVAALGELTLDQAPAGWTLATASRWWRVTHTREELTVRALGEGRFELTSRSGVAGVVIELLHPDGLRREHVLDLAGDHVLLEEPVERSGLPVTWEDTLAVYTQEIERFYERVGVVPDSDKSITSIDNNTVWVSNRGEHILRILRELAGREALSGCTVLDAGAGFGALAGYLAWRAHPDLVIAVERDEEVRATAQAAADRLALGSLVEVVRGDIRDLRTLRDRSVDVVVAYGVLMYLLTGRDLRRALREFNRVLVPGGHLIIYQANRWQLRDPATGRRFIHLLPRPLGRTALRLAGRGRTYKRWLSPLELQWRLRLTGFARPAWSGYGSEVPHNRGVRRYLDHSFALAAVRLPRRREEPLRNVHRRRLAQPTGSRPFVRRERIAEVYDAALRRFYAERNAPLETPAEQITLRTNTVLVPRRGDQLLQLLSELAGVPSLEGLRVLELGSGFGALACFLAWKGRPAELIGGDIASDYVQLANRCANELGLASSLRFEQIDMRDLSAFESDSIDVVICNNSFIYLTSRRDEDRALSEFRRVLAPGGAVLFYHANKWRWTEPFTGDPVVHLLPAPLGRALSRVTGWRHNHGRVRLISQPSLRRRALSNGLRGAGGVGFRGKARHTRWPLRNLGGFYALAAHASSGGRRLRRAALGAVAALIVAAVVTAALMSGGPTPGHRVVLLNTALGSGLLATDVHGRDVASPRSVAANGQAVVVASRRLGALRSGEGISILADLQVADLPGAPGHPHGDLQAQTRLVLAGRPDAVNGAMVGPTRSQAVTARARFANLAMSGVYRAPARLAGRTVFANIVLSVASPTGVCAAAAGSGNPCLLKVDSAVSQMTVVRFPPEHLPPLRSIAVPATALTASPTGSVRREIATSPTIELRHGDVVEAYGQLVLAASASAPAPAPARGAARCQGVFAGQLRFVSSFSGGASTIGIPMSGDLGVRLAPMSAPASWSANGVWRAPEGPVRGRVVLTGGWSGAPSCGPVTVEGDMSRVGFRIYRAG